jgi:hypothetical protein
MLKVNETSDVLDQDELLDVLSSLRDGRFSARMSYNYTGRAGQVAAALNDTLELLTCFREELSRTAEELGVTGRLGGQVRLSPTAGEGWLALAADVNRAAANLTDHLRRLSQSAEAAAIGRPLPHAADTAWPVRGELKDLSTFVLRLAQPRPV